jgi:hypothetical protein
LNVAPTELPAVGDTPSDGKDRDDPATGAGHDYMVFGAARKWRGILLRGYFLQEFARNSCEMSLRAGGLSKDAVDL